MSKKRRCAWILDRGYWKGYPCCNEGAVSRGELMYCSVHFGMGENSDRLAKQAKLRQASLKKDGSSDVKGG
jgi:hypothetical protein